MSLQFIVVKVLADIGPNTIMGGLNIWLVWDANPIDTPLSKRRPISQMTLVCLSLTLLLEASPMNSLKLILIVARLTLQWVGGYWLIPILKKLQNTKAWDTTTTLPN